MPMTGDRRGTGACPSFFKALCRTASLGGSNGYEWAGYGLIGAVHSLVNFDDTLEEWSVKMEELQDLICQKDDDDAVLAWFDRELPRCMALVPRNRRHLFLKGIYRAVIDEEQDVFDV